MKVTPEMHKSAMEQALAKLSEADIEEGRMILDQNISDVSIGIVAQEFLAFLRKHKIDYDIVLQCTDVFCHPLKLGCNVCIFSVVH